MRGEILADGRRWGPRFVALRGTPDGPGWTPAEALFDGELDRALAEVGEARGTTSRAVAATLLLDVHAQRVAAPVLGALHLEGRHLDARLPLVHVERSEGGAHRLAFAHDPRPVDDPEGDAARRLVLDGLVGGHLALLVDALHARTGAGVRVLRGTIANAVAITYLHLSWPDADRARFVPMARRALAETPGLGGLATVAAVREGGEPWMYTDRNACCLAFRTTVNRAREQPYCATCPVLAPAVTRDLFARATAAYRERHG